MKRKEPEGGFAPESMEQRLKRFKSIASIQQKVELRNTAESDKENLNSKSNNKKSFRDKLKETNEAFKDNSKKEETTMPQELLKKMMNLTCKASQNNKLPLQNKGSQPAVDDSYVSEERLFPALIYDPTSDVINDYSIKSFIKISWTINFDWINSVSFDHEDNRYKTDLHKILDFYTYPSTGFDLMVDKAVESQRSRSSNSNSLKNLDKEWFISLKDWYVKWLAFDEPDGKPIEFSIITKQYKVVFISQGCIKNGAISRKRFAIVGNPDKLVDSLINSKVNFKKFKKPQMPKKKKSREEGGLIDNYGIDFSDEDDSIKNDPAFTQPNYGSTQELFAKSYIESQDNESVDISIIKDFDPCSILIEEADLHGLINALLVHCKPYIKDVRLVASFSFTNLNLNIEILIGFIGKMSDITGIDEYSDFFSNLLQGVDSSSDEEDYKVKSIKSGLTQVKQKDQELKEESINLQPVPQESKIINSEPKAELYYFTPSQTELNIEKQINVPPKSSIVNFSEIPKAAQIERK